MLILCQLHACKCFSNAIVLLFAVDCLTQPLVFCRSINAKQSLVWCASRNIFFLSEGASTHSCLDMGPLHSTVQHEWAKECPQRGRKGKLRVITRRDDLCKDRKAGVQKHPAPTVRTPCHATVRSTMHLSHLASTLRTGHKHNKRIMGLDVFIGVCLGHPSPQV